MEYLVNGKTYRLSSKLNAFQLELQVHLVDWKWRHITKEPGTSGGHPYDVVLPDSVKREQQTPLIYPGVAAALSEHRVRNGFRLHRHFHHMASSQAANINLFLPILMDPGAAAILHRINPDFASLATDQLDRGFCIEYWGGNYDKSDAVKRSRGLLGDKSAMAGTDSDIAIAYRNQQNQLCLWLIEHKLTEDEFTKCGGARSKGRDARHDCGKSFSGLLKDKEACYYHSKSDRQFKYWEITDRHQSFFVSHDIHPGCPFKGGMNQLWRNQLLGLAIEDDPAQLFENVMFSVVKHPRNDALNTTLDSYKTLIGRNAKFTVFDSDRFIRSAEAQGSPDLTEWARWYRGVYKL